MPVRLRITILFATTVCCILMVVCATVYYFAWSNRLNSIKTRLLNRASYTNGLLSQGNIFTSDLVVKLDTSITGMVRSKEVQVFDSNDQLVYSFSDISPELMSIDSELLQHVREEGTIFFTKDDKEALAVHYPSSGLLVVSATRDEQGKKYLTQLKTTIWISLVGGILIAFGGGYFFSGRLLRPVKQIADEVNEISAGSLTRRIQTGKSRDEWHYLSETLNKLLNRLQRSFEVQRQFIANASHELCTPLTSISSQLEVSLLRSRDAEHYRKVISSTLQDVLRMSQLTQSLLEVARASGSPGGFEIEQIRIDEVLLQLPVEITKLNNQWSVNLDFDHLPADETKLLVFGNQELLLTAIRNIVINACKYAPDHQAKIGLHVLNGEIRVMVADNGPGIPKDELENIFLPFYRSAGAGKEKGFGLGLSLANHIIQLHNGNIRVHSDVGRGSVFSIYLPQAGSNFTFNTSARIRKGLEVN
jgi:two-component system sensor histidine kinase ArlS